MPLDFSIPLRAFAGQFNPAEAQQRALTLKSAMDEQRLRGIQMEDALEERGRKRTLRDLMSKAIGPDGQVNEQTLRGAYVQTGDAEGLMQFDANAAARAKAAAESRAAELKRAMDQVGYIAQLAGSATDQASYTAALQRAQAAGMDVSSLPAQYDPQVVAGIRNSALSAEAQARQEMERLKFSYQQQNDAADRAVTIRGQNLTDARAREANASTKPPAGYRWAANGVDLVPIKGGPADKGAELKEAETKARSAASIMNEALKTVAELGPKVTPGVWDRRFDQVPNGAGARFIPEQSKRLLDAQRAFVSAKLRFESGATITPDEIENEVRIYFPQPGESGQILRDKAKLRAAAINNIRAAGKMPTRGGGNPTSLSQMSDDQILAALNGR